MSRSVEQRHAIQKRHRPTAQMEYQGIIWVIKADVDKRIAELEAVLDRCREPVAYASDRAHENNAESLSRVYASIGPWICRVLSEGGADD